MSLRDKTQADLGLKPGDTLELTLFGESIEVTVANFREFQFQSGLNFLVTASPGTFDDFPGTNLATIKTAVGEEKNVERALAKRYPDITFIPVGDALNQAASILSQLSTAVNIVGGLAVANGLLVLAGTMAAGRKQREADAVVNKVLGSTRARRGARVRARICAARCILGAARDGRRHRRRARHHAGGADGPRLHGRPGAGGRRDGGRDRADDCDGGADDVERAEHAAGAVSEVAGLGASRLAALASSAIDHGSDVSGVLVGGAGDLDSKPVPSGMAPAMDSVADEVAGHHAERDAQPLYDRLQRALTFAGWTEPLQT